MTGASTQVQPTSGFVAAVVTALSLLLVVVSGGTRAVAEARASRSDEGATYAVLIGVEEYERCPPLEYCEDDVMALAETLRLRTRHENFGSRVPFLVDYSDRILIVTDKADVRPTLENLVTRVPELLEKARPGDSVLVFFSGHGVQDKSGRTWLAPIDCDPENVDATALAIGKLRGIMQDCRASKKLLIVDACHAAGEKGLGLGLTSKDLEPELKRAEGVYTLASCQEHQTSAEWPDKKRGLFTYWLTRGLAGAADGDADEVITADELYRFVNERVRACAERQGRKQTPARIVPGSVSGEIRVLRLAPESWDSAMPRLSELTHEELLDHNVRRVGLVEFGSLLGGREDLGQTGTFGRLATESVEKELLTLAGGRYGVADQRQVTSVLRGVEVEDLTRPRVLNEVSENIPRLDAILTGYFVRKADPDRLTLHSKLLKLPEGDLWQSITSVIHVDAGLWGHLGGSMFAGESGLSVSEEVADFESVPRLNEWAGHGHPLKDPEFPFPLHLTANGRTKQWHEIPGRPNDLFVAAVPGEEFAIHVENRTEQRVTMNLLVDGMNTIVQHDEDKEVQRVPIQDARGWVLEPGKSYVIRGWHLARDPVTGLQEVRRFKFVEPSQSVAGRRGFAEDIGMITAAFYTYDTHPFAPAIARPLAPNTLAVGEGAREYVRTTPAHVSGLRKLVALVNVRYVHQDAL